MSLLGYVIDPWGGGPCWLREDLLELGVGVPYVTVWLSVGMDWFLTVGYGWVDSGFDSCYRVGVSKVWSGWTWGLVFWSVGIYLGYDLV